MEKLISVDALLKELQAKFDRAEMDAKFTGSRDINVSWNDAICAIKQAKTVEAIPKEWIKHWCIKHYPTYPRIITEHLLKNTETWRMIEDWEKENADR